VSPVKRSAPFVIRTDKCSGTRSRARSQMVMVGGWTSVSPCHFHHHPLDLDSADISVSRIERFGLWMTISSFIVMLGVVDLGNGLINLLADALARDDREAASTYVASTVFVTGTIAIIL